MAIDYSDVICVFDEKKTLIAAIVKPSGISSLTGESEEDVRNMCEQRYPSPSNNFHYRYGFSELGRNMENWMGMKLEDFDFKYAATLN